MQFSRTVLIIIIVSILVGGVAGFALSRLYPAAPADINPAVLSDTIKQLNP